MFNALFPQLFVTQFKSVSLDVEWSTRVLTRSMRDVELPSCLFSLFFSLTVNSG